LSNQTTAAQVRRRSFGDQHLGRNSQHLVDGRAQLVEQQVRIELCAAIGRNRRRVGDVGEAVIDRPPAHVVQAGAARRCAHIEGQDRAISRHSLAYMLCAASEMFRHYDFDPMDLILIHAVLNANVLNIMKDPELDRRLGSIQAVEPDEIKQGVSRAALSRFLGIPIETVRRRADRLKKEGVLRETEHGLIVTEANQFKFGNNHELQKTNILLVRKFLRDLMEAGVEVPGGI